MPGPDLNRSLYTPVNVDGCQNHAKHKHTYIHTYIRTYIHTDTVRGSSDGGVGPRIPALHRTAPHAVCMSKLPHSSAQHTEKTRICCGTLFNALIMLRKMPENRAERAPNAAGCNATSAPNRFGALHAVKLHQFHSFLRQSKKITLLTSESLSKMLGRVAIATKTGCIEVCWRKLQKLFADSGEIHPTSWVPIRTDLCGF